MVSRLIHLCHEIGHAQHHQSHHIKLVFILVDVLELLAKVDEFLQDAEGDDCELDIALPQVGSHHFQELLIGSHEVDGLLVGQVDQVAEDVRDLAPDLQRLLVVQQLLQLGSDHRFQDHCLRSCPVGAEIGDNPAPVLAVDGLRAHQEGKDALQERTPQQHVDIVLILLSQHVAQYPQGQVAHFRLLCL
jgi:hypothetical protein